MLTIRILTENRAVTGKNEIEVVERMRDVSPFTRDQGLDEYMRGMADRTKEMYGYEIRYDNAVALLQDLAHYGLIAFESKS